jgi:hypothetical protein
VEAQVRECYSDWDFLLANPRFCRNERRIAWNRYTGGIIRPPITYEKVRSLIEAKQYSFQCADDGSIFQLLYEFDDKNAIRTVRLAFYKANLPLGEDESDSGSGPIPDFGDIFVPWLRFDYTKEYASGVLHHDSHMHVSGFPEARFAVSGVPGPRQFVEFVIASCFPEYYRGHRLDSKGRYVSPHTVRKVNVSCLPCGPNSVTDKIIHIRVP